MADGSDPLFSLDVVRDFIVSRGGKVSNHELVSHFKHFLMILGEKVANRQKFKTFVNTLASVKLDASGEKLLVLKRKFREGIYSSSGSTGAASGETEGGDGAPKAKVESAADAAEPTEDVDKDTVPAGAEAASGTEQEPEETVEKASQEGPQTTETGQESAAAGADIAETDEQTTESSASVASDDGVFVDAVEQLPVAKEDTEASAAAEAKESSKESSPAAEVGDTAETSPSTEGRDSVFSEVVSEAESLPSPDDIAKAAVEAAMAPDLGEEKEADSTDASNENDVCVTPLKQVAGEEGTTNTPMSVKERARHLNRMESQTELEKTTPTAPKTPKEFKPSERRSTEEKDESQTSGSVSLDSTERQWLVLAATTDYHPMAKILLTNAHLVKQKVGLNRKLLT
ncbi:hypothetical protein NP493_96g05039 [Ridgeia piscesae]|uniref:SOWAHA-C winged helix-turn-helix domain-containing protein n=1 Tax=Ridgeia piscesae TaxID=27915 RepID=A0AAD9P7Y6_RIDPI|nr:hypothetical protein NP493_96g05039 [Ridgeia piscesae]